MKGFEKGDTVGHYYGALVHKRINSSRGQDSVYGLCILSVSKQEFRTWALRPRNDVWSPAGEPLLSGQFQESVP